MIYFHTYKNPGLIIDIVGDIRRLNDMSVRAKKAGMIVLGGGVCKHQIANAMLFVSHLTENLELAVRYLFHVRLAFSEMEPIMLSTSTPVRNSTVQTRGLDRTKLFRGAKFGLALSR